MDDYGRNYFQYKYSTLNDVFLLYHIFTCENCNSKSCGITHYSVLFNCCQLQFCFTMARQVSQILIEVLHTKSR